MKLTKAARAKLIDPMLRNWIVDLGDDALLAVHDLTHQEMERRHGTNRRPEAGRRALQEAEKP